MPLAKVLHGKFHTGKLNDEGKRIIVNAGDEVEVSESAMMNFKDQLQLVVPVEAPSSSARRSRRASSDSDGDSDNE